MLLRYISAVLLLCGVAHSASAPADWESPKNFTASLSHITFGGLPEYSIDARLGNTTVPLLFDLGSTLVWVITPDFRCLDAQNKTIPQEDCEFSTPFGGSFNEGTHSGGNFSASYIDPNGLAQIQGDFGFEDLSVAGINGNRQRIGLVDEVANLQGADGAISGFLGMGGSVYLGKSTFFTEAVNEGLVGPVMCVELHRREAKTAGNVVFGASAISQSNFSSVPLIHNSNGSFTALHFNGQGMSLGGKPLAGSSNLTTGVDSGYPLFLFPDNVAAAINAQYDPPARLNLSEGYSQQWKVECNASTPDFAVTIEGKEFYMNPLDKIARFGNVTDECYSVFTNNSHGPGATAPNSALLGNSFLRNVFLDIDVKNLELRFAPHIHYE